MNNKHKRHAVRQLVGSAPHRTGRMQGVHFSDEVLIRPVGGQHDDIL
ncbi:hypothetical protein SAMN05216524_102117 [Mucilaginibacter sp. OK098]|nr:hypothetical protein SAMN05216524_102117 [Mucilaginibacter sp. OK098]